MESKMLAGVFMGEGVLEIQQRPRPELPGPDWVILENEGCGVCGTDLHILSVPPAVAATPGAILGHEVIGQVVETGPAVTTTNVGDRVAVAANLTCGLCRYCKAGKSLHCENWTTLGIHKDGGFARYMAAPERALHQVSKTLPFAEAVWIEPLSCVVNCTDLATIQPGQTAVVIGAGPIGILHGMMYKAAGARIIISDLAPYRLEVAKQAGMDVVVNIKTDSLAEVVKAETGGWGAELVVDAVGNQFGTALELAAKQGKIALFGVNEKARPSARQYLITRNELTVFGSFVGENTFPRAIQILESGAIKPSVMNSMVLPLPDIFKGIAAARQGEAVKVVVTTD
ncbi:MAG: alcohol dehydrogenase catalytic domain-containing protein [Anaerolineales bacterium]|nr:alcohol dehydrogenase catalytic domain-containing protein [Anaerolineales bacterium]